jgi:signal peptidase I
MSGTGWPPAEGDDEETAPHDPPPAEAPLPAAPAEPFAAAESAVGVDPFDPVAPVEPAAPAVPKDPVEPSAPVVPVEQSAPVEPEAWPLPPAAPPVAPGSGSGEGDLDGGWPVQRGLEEQLPVHPPLPHLPHAPTRSVERHSRNPVDRLTRGLPPGIRVTVDWIVTIVGAVAIVLLVKAFVVNPYRIPSSSMETTLHCAQPASGCEARYSDRVLANRFIYHLRDPRRGEIVVFQTPPAAQVKCGAGGTFVKRLVGLPGETVEVRLRRGDGYVYINGTRLVEPYIEKDRRGAVESFGPVKIPPGAYFMMGDNRSQSCDSRVWGSVPRANLIGKVFATYWPPNRLSLH